MPPRKPPAPKSKTKAAPKNTEPSPRRRFAPVSLSSALIKAAMPHLVRRGLAEESLLTHWTDIMGPMLAERTQPDRLARGRGDEPGVLHLLVESGSVALEIQHMSEQIIDRINTFLGRRAVGRLQIKHGTLKRTRTRKAEPPPLPPETVEKLDEFLQPVEDPQLKAALRRLGECVLRNETMRPSRG